MLPDFYNDMDAAGKVLQQIKGMRAKVESYNKLKETWEDLLTLVELAIEENDEIVFSPPKGFSTTLKIRYYLD